MQDVFITIDQTINNIDDKIFLHRHYICNLRIIMLIK
jgi:hypothetical protein